MRRSFRRASAAGSATASPSGIASVNDHPALPASSLEFWTVSTSVEVAAAGAEVGEKLGVTIGVAS